MSKAFLQKLVDVMNKLNFIERLRLKLISEAEELSSPKPRMLHRIGYNKIYAMAKGMSPTITITGITPTNSMEPVIDDGHIALIEDKPNLEDLVVGDIILFFRRLDNNPKVLHRIIEINTDSVGWYCITQGDNTVWLDGKIRYKDILGICVGIIY